MSDLGNRLKQALASRGITQSKLAKEIGVSQQSIQYLSSGKARKSGHTASIARALNISVDWLEKGIGQMEVDIDNALPTYKVLSSIPLISWVQAGQWADIQLGEIEQFYPCPENHSQHTYALEVKGESMSPDYINGEIIFVDPEVEARNGSCVVVRQNGNSEATFKQLIVDGNQKYLKALNPNWPSPIIEMLPDATICGVVIGSYRKRN
jgi:SOS-response transcriptional repressor LexA